MGSSASSRPQKSSSKRISIRRNSLKDGAEIQKLKEAELLEEQKAVEKQKVAEYEAETQEIQQQVAKTKGRAKILEDLNE